MDFDWDDPKAATNLRKHGIAFSDAALVFLDPLRIEAIDQREAYGEDRWKTVGQIEGTLVAVIFTVRDDASELIRIISARKADANERKAYRETHH